MAATDPRENHQRFQEFWNAGDVEGLVDLYAEDAVYLAPGGQKLCGHSEIRAMLEQMAKLGSRTRLELLRLTENGDLALERTRWTMQFPGEDGKTTEQEGFSTVVLRRGADGAWRMIVDDPGI
jgi:uncharacterized protein (TIGR02246 family)